MKKVLFLAAILVLSMSSAFAGTITFVGTNEAKPFSYTPGGTFSVTGLSLQSLFIGSTEYSIGSGTLDVSSGTYFGSATIAGSTIIGFNPGGGITITGSVPGRGVGSTTTLLTGTFLDDAATFTPGGGGSFGGALQITYINPYVFSGIVLSASDAQTLLKVTLSGGTFSGEISSSQVTLDTPEPGTMALLGFGALALPWSLRKHMIRR
jgi:hypothetical protein